MEITTLLSGFALLLLVPLAAKQIAQHFAPAAETPNPTILLFENDFLIDATGDGLLYLGITDGEPFTIQDLTPALYRLFPSLGAGDQVLSNDIEGVASDIDPHLRLSTKRVGNRLRVILSASDAGYWQKQLLSDQATVLKTLQQHTPHTMWLRDSAGQIIWANENGAALPPDTMKKLETETSREKVPERRYLSIPSGGKDRWFEVHHANTDGGHFFAATDAAAMVKVDAQRKHFVQTLGKTFAQLSIGLAIFDTDRALVMFNPALHEITGLPVDFLANRPSIEMLLDRLRELRILPEPKDYMSWKEQFLSLEKQARDGTYCETWALPDGQTFRVTGKPHPEGAFALLFEDISAEVSQYRRFRSNIEASQAILDLLPQGIAVFSMSGTMVMTNRAYSDLWATDPELMFDRRDWMTETKTWQADAIPTKTLELLTSFDQAQQKNGPFFGELTLEDGRRISCQANQIAGGMTMVSFTPLGATFANLPAHAVVALDKVTPAVS